MSAYAQYNPATGRWYLINAHTGRREVDRGFLHYRLAELYATNKGIEFVGLIELLEANGFEHRNPKRFSGYVTLDQYRLAQVALNITRVPHTLTREGDKAYIVLGVGVTKA